MQSYRHGVVLGLLFFGLHARGHRALAEEYDFTGITISLKKAVEDTPLDGTCLLIVKDGQTIYEQCFGKYKPETVVSIASASKWLSAATMMTLVDEGKPSLDDPVSKYLPKYTGKNGEITIRQLLSHTSGLAGDDPAIGTFRITLREAADQIAEIPLVADPGKEFRYGGVSMQVAGAIAESVSGKSWADLFQERIAGPCEMKNTRYGHRLQQDHGTGGHQEVGGRTGRQGGLDLGLPRRRVGSLGIQHGQSLRGHQQQQP